MLDDFIPIKRHFEGDEDIIIVPISDVHCGSREFNEKLFDRVASQIVNTPNMYAVIVGDVLDNGIKSSVTNVYEATMRPSEAKLLMAAKLKPLADADKILCLTDGNHEARSIREVDDSPLYDIACKLNIENLYRPNACFVKLQMGDTKGNGSRNPTYTLLCTHGSGGGATIGGAANRAMRTVQIFEGIDCIIQGHTHKPMDFVPQRIVFDTQNNKIRRKNIVSVVAPSFLDYGGYALRGGFAPFGYTDFALTLRRCRKEILLSRSVSFDR